MKEEKLAAEERLQTMIKDLEDEIAKNERNLGMEVKSLRGKINTLATKGQGAQAAFRAVWKWLQSAMVVAAA